ncbi:MAG TPA: amidohydrolase family protein [Gemmatimonadales bacterium]|nr:amidohydrolase family protein [Gemmatimonadales bacterium]
MTRSALPAVAAVCLTVRLAAQTAPLDAFRSNIAAIHARDRAAYLSYYLHTPALARVGPDGLHQGYDDFAKGAGAGWPDTLVATHVRIVPVTPDVAFGVYRYRVVDSSGSVRGVSERVLVRTPQGWRVAVTTAFAAPDAAPPPMAIVGATLVDGTGTAGLRDAVVVMRDGRIACAGSRAACPVPPDADTVSARGKWVMPGLIDTHVHFSQTGWVDGRPDALDLRDRYPYEAVEAELHARPERFFRSYLCSGVTSVFDVGGYPWTLALQERTAKSTTAPRVVAAGSLLSTIDFWLNLPDQRQFIYMADEATVRRAVQAHKAWGAAAIKVWYIMPPQPPDTARMSALVHAAGDEARKVGLPLIVHATGLWEAKDAVRAGARVLVHSVWSVPVDDEFLTLARRQGTIYVPTLMVPDGYRQVAARRFARDRQPLACVDHATRAKALATDTVALARRASDSALAERTARTARSLVQAQANLKRVHEAGIPIALGTDAGNPLTLHGASVFMELEAMQASGLAPRDVLAAATANAARALGLDSTGTVAPGSVADLLVLDADPLADVRNVRDIALIVRRGEIYTRHELEY